MIVRCSVTVPLFFGYTEHSFLIQQKTKKTTGFRGNVGFDLKTILGLMGVIMGPEALIMGPKALINVVRCSQSPFNARI